ncbi:MAG TPA: hypothetical protein VFR68_09460 [Candidatus Dormibacteraeota bacterium]|nr:hypothetical protein [Candidatus Dormibacteraeota bacterium]
MKRLIAPLLAAAAVTFGLAWLPALADTPGPAPACVSPSVNPHPTAPVGPTTDTLFCTQPATNGTGSGNGSNGSNGTNGTNGSTGTGGSTGAASHGTTQTAGYNAGTGAGSGTTTTAAGTSGGQTMTTSGSGASTTRTAPASGGFFGGLVAFLGAAGGLALLFGFLLLLAIGLFIVAVVMWLTRRGGSLGSRLASVAHRP